MSTYRLDKLFAPASVALVGASWRERSFGRALFVNLRQSGFAGRLYPVNPNHDAIDGVQCYRALSDLPEAPDLVVVVSPAPSVPGVIRSAGDKGAAAVIVMSPGLGHGPGSLADVAYREARKRGIRFVGPNCLGVMNLHQKLNASFAARAPGAGDLALISQSGAVVAGLVEWAARRGVGLSSAVSLGDQLDVDFGDCLDYFATDPHTRAILLYLESVGDARKFMSAARVAARAKPVVVIKSGRHPQGARITQTHTAKLAGSDEVYDAAFRRAGLLRVLDLDELFAAAETLGRQRPFLGRRLAILANDRGIGALAVDRLIDLGGTLAEVSEETSAALDKVLPPDWSRANPVDILGDADAARYGAATEALLADKANDALLVINIPSALASTPESIDAVVSAVEADRAAKLWRKPVFAVLLSSDESSARRLEKGAVSRFSTEAEAVQGFMHMVRYREAQDLLMETPDNLPRDFTPNVSAAKAVVTGALLEGRSWLNPLEVSALLRAYDIPAGAVTLARTPDEAALAARDILAEGGTVAVKIVSPDILHKSDVGGVKLDLTSEEAVRAAAADILGRVAKLQSNARIDGVVVQKMVRRPKARELIVGLADDPEFGPVVVFGRGGTAVEVINDKSLALPPLDLKLAEILIARTRVSRILKAYRDVPAADEHALRLVLVKLSQLAADLPEVRELDINPLLADQDGIIAVDARVRVEAIPAGPRRGWHPRFTIRPYPRGWERTIVARNGKEIFVRPVRPEDETLFVSFLKRVNANDLRLRFFAPIREFSHSFLARLVQIDYARAIAFVAIDPPTGDVMGVVRLHADANHQSGEYAVLVRSDLKGYGLGRDLMRLIIEWAKADGLTTVEGQVLADNAPMLALCRKLGFSVHPDPEDASIRLVRLPLGDAEPSWHEADELAD